jgi:hypothetical protein
VIQAVAQRLGEASLQFWVTRVNRVSLAMTWPGITPDDRMTFRGDALELLTEFLLKSCPHHVKHGVSDYQVVPSRDDMGVDAIGINIIRERIVIQCKFRSNPLDLVHYSDLARTFTSGVISYGLNPHARKNLWLVTTANDANINSHKVLGKRLHVLGNSHLRSQVDGNQTFWACFLASVQASISNVASSLGITVTELVLKAIKGCTQVLDLFPIIEKPIEPVIVSEPLPVAPEAPVEQVMKASVILGDKKYSNPTWVGLLQDVLNDVGYRKVFDAYPEDERQLLFLERPTVSESVKRRITEKIEGKYKFYLNCNLSSKDILKFLGIVATSLGLEFKESK